MQNRNVVDTDKVEGNHQRRDQLLDRDQLFTAARPRLLRIARLRGVAPDALEDVVQETLLVAWKKFDYFYTPGYTRQWLDAICRNICARYVRSAYRETLRQAPLLDEQLLAGEPGEMVEMVAGNERLLSPDPAEMLDKQDLYNLLGQALNLLPSSARDAVEMYYLLELPQREAAVRLGLSISALETRLHRARQQLREILGGHLRQQATSLDLPLDEEPATGWRATAVWCYYCGQQRLHGFFETLPDGERYLRMRCPECSRRFGSDIVNGRGFIGVENLRSFQPAFKRTMRGVSRQLLQAISTGVYACGYCGRPAPIAVRGPKQERESAPDHPLQRYFWVRGRCPYCKNDIGGFSADDVVYWSLPETQEFMQRFPRWLNAPDLPIEFNGQAAILFRLSDRLSAAQLHVITHRQTLQVLATFRQ